jgi:methyl-accepting chemotaxis protein
VTVYGDTLRAVQLLRTPWGEGTLAIASPSGSFRHRTIRLSLRLKVGLAVALSLGALSSALVGFLDWRTAAMLQARVERNGEVVAEQLALGLRAAVEFDDATGAAEVLASVRASPDALFAVVARDGVELARWARPGIDPSTTHAAMEVDRPVLGSAATGASKLADLRLGLDDRELRDTRARSFGVFVLAALVVSLVGLVVGVALGDLLVTPLLRLTGATADVAKTGDISRDFVVASGDEVGVLAGTFNALVGSLRGMVSTQQDAADGLGQVVDELSTTGRTVAGSTEGIREQMDATAGATAALEQAVSVLADSIAVLRRSADTGRTSIDTISKANQAAVGQINAMVSSTERTLLDLQAVAASAGETARSVEGLDDALEQAAAAVDQMRATVENIEKSSIVTANLAHEAADAARSGAETLGESRRSMEEIATGFGTTTESLTSLEHRIEHIGEILAVISDVADKTSLLALNASIIAAQAGEQGRGFTVVAEEIKVLADRTRRATQESVGIVRGIEEQARAAEDRMRESAGRVQTGLRVNKRAVEAFERILSSSERSSHMVAGIARATEEHAQGARHIADTMQSIAASVRVLRDASGAQASRAAAMSQATAEVSQMAAEVLAAGRGQAASSDRLTEVMARIAETVARVGEAHAAQELAVAQVVRATGETRRSGDAQQAAVFALARSIESLREQAGRLQSAFGRFGVGHDRATARDVSTPARSLA